MAGSDRKRGECRSGKRRTGRRHGTVSGAAAAVLSFAGLIIVWQIGALIVNAPLILPAPYTVLRRLCALCTTALFWRSVAATCGRVFLSFAVTLITGSILGVWCGLNKTVNQICALPLTVIRSTPVVAFILLALFWLGSSLVPVFVAVLMALPVYQTAVQNGFSRSDPKLAAMARVYGFTKRETFRYVRLPQALPSCGTGAVSSFGMCWKVVAAGEVLSIPRWGAGSLMQTAQVHLETADVLAVTVVVVLLDYVFGRLLELSIKAARKRRPLRRGAGCRADAGVDTPQPADVPLSAAELLSPEDAHLPKPVSVHIRNLSVTRGGRQLYCMYSLDIPAGETAALIAASGAGKTTLLDCIAGLPVDGSGTEVSGTVQLTDGTCAAGTDRVCSGQRAAVSYLFQTPCLLPDLPLEQNVALPLYHLMPRAEALCRARKLLAQCGLGSRAGSYPSELSGGEAQRAAVARAFAYPAGLLLMDEAFQSQDIDKKTSLMQLLARLLQTAPRTVILVTHDILETSALCSHIVVLQGTPLEVTYERRYGSVPADPVKAYLNPDAAALSVESDIRRLLAGVK